MTPSGRLRETVEIQRKNEVSNGRGGMTTPPGQERWVSERPGVRAEIVPLRGDVALNLAVQRAVQLYRVTIRYRPGILAGQHRLLWKGVALDIKSAARSPDRRDLVMTAQSGVPS